MVPYFKSINLFFEQHTPTSAQELLAILEAVTAKCVLGRGPIIHFDMHGLKDKGLHIVGSGEFITWEVLTASLKQINIRTGNNLGTVLATCFSYNIIQHLDVLAPCPFYMLIAPENEVTAGFLEDKIPSFYKDVFGGLNAVEAYNTHLTGPMKLLHSERMLALVLIHYIRSSCMGKGGDTRKEHLMTEMIQSRNIMNTRNNRRLLRKSLKTLIKPTQSMVDRYMAAFLIGKRVDFKVEELMNVAVRERNNNSGNVLC